MLRQHRRNLGLPIHMEPRLLCHIGNLHVHCANLLLHHLLQDLDRQLLRILQRQVLLVRVLQGGLRRLRPRADGLGFVLGEGAARVGKESSATLLAHGCASLVQLGAKLVNTGNQQGNTKRSALDAHTRLRPEQLPHGLPGWSCRRCPSPRSAGPGHRRPVSGSPP